jgi:hypothetical protein
MTLNKFKVLYDERVKKVSDKKNDALTQSVYSITSLKKCTIKGRAVKMQTLIASFRKD